MDAKAEYIFKLISAAGIIFGIFYTGYQLKTANTNEEAKLIYSIQKDAREISKQSLSDPYFTKCILSANICSDEDLDKGYSILRPMLQFYSSVKNQEVIGSLNSDVWNIWRAEFCSFVRLKRVNEFLQSAGDKSGYEKEFLEEVSRCLNVD